MSIYKRGTTYSYDFWSGGKRFTGNTGATTRAKANEFIVDMKRKLRLDREAGTKDITLAEALRTQVDSNSKADTSISTYETRIKRLTGQIEGHWGFDPKKFMSSLTTADIETLKVRRQGEGMAPSTVAVEIGQLKAAHALCKAMGFAVDHTTVFKRPRFKPKMRSLSADEERKLIEAMHPATRAATMPWGTLEAAPRHVRAGLWDLHDLVVFLLDTGCRHNEAVKARWSDVSVDLKTIDVRRWKTGKETVVYTTARLREVLTRRSKERGNATLFIFAAAADPTKPRPYRVTAITDVMDRLGFNADGSVERWGRATVHSLRHTYASKLLRTGKYDLYRLKDRLGHSSIKSTEIYGHLEVDDDARKASEILDDLEGVS